MKKLLCLLFAAFLLCVSASALELPSGLDDVVPRELIDSAEAGDDLLLRGGQYLFSHFRAALQDAVANSLRGAMALMLLSILCGLVESTAESAGETPTRYAGLSRRAGRGGALSRGLKRAHRPRRRDDGRAFDHGKAPAARRSPQRWRAGAVWARQASGRSAH